MYNNIAILKRMEVIFETDRLIVRRLKMNDFELFHKMQSNSNVMKFVRPRVNTFEENKSELKRLIGRYEISTNDFWIYAIELKETNTFIGTVALIKDGKDDEIGYRLLEEEWSKGYGVEVTNGLVEYCKKIGLKKLVAYAAIANVASTKILQKLNFKFIKKLIAEDLNIEEQKFELKL
jgi:RimJ/RimL family protein N-acetyltransferase